MTLPSTPPTLRARTAARSAISTDRDNDGATYRSYCSRCARPQPTCICHALPPDGPIAIPNIEILILQHPREARKRKRTSTVPLIGLCVDNVTICVGTKFERVEDGSDSGDNCPSALGKVLSAPENAILLYPGHGTTSLTDKYSSADTTNDDDDESTRNGRARVNDAPTATIVVIDGTWAQARAMMQSSPCLGVLPQYMFDDDTTSLFNALRREPASHCTSTLEAVSRALRVIAVANKGDNDAASAAAFEGAEALENSLRAMVEGQLRYARDESKGRPRSKKFGDDGTAGRSRTRKIRRRRQAQLQLSGKLTEEEIEASRIRFIYVGHLG
eukprot:CAMPEP_0172515656 /NCGR_PEP_ID=MMETSP1066-20121228/269655_1 /TAXON_ID=671091 /ORGANISM="Coscinodiscus wailesii, Strain CCMP2513" /LENGTH=329 /DNA_ID=CAMNT_0013296789 /DNA_START=343 /DNA_END=1332 /DNA_ORIENTATION=+